MARFSMRSVLYQSSLHGAYHRLSVGLAATSLVFALPAYAQNETAAQLDKLLRSCRVPDTTTSQQVNIGAVSDDHDDVCRRQAEATVAIVHDALAEQPHRGADDETWRAAYSIVGRLLGRPALLERQAPVSQEARPPPAPPALPTPLAPAQSATLPAAERRKDTVTQRDIETGHRIDAIARIFFPELSGQTQGDNLAWAAAYGAAYQVIDVLDVSPSHAPALQGIGTKCVDAAAARLIANEIQKYGADPVLGMLRYMTEYVHKVTFKISDETPRYLTLTNNTLTVNPRLYVREAALFGPIVSERLNTEETASQTTVVKLKGMMGKYWSDVERTKGWGTAVEVKQLIDYRTAIDQQWHTPIDQLIGKPLEASACLAFPDQPKAASDTHPDDRRPNRVTPS